MAQIVKKIRRIREEVYFEEQYVSKSKKVPTRMRYAIPNGFNPIVIYNKTTDKTTIEYYNEIVEFEGKIFGDKIRPTTYNCWNYWRYGGI